MGSRWFGEVISFHTVHRDLGKEIKALNSNKADHLGGESLREINGVIGFCEKEFGTKLLDDASRVWVQDKKSSASGNTMVVGGKGWRQF